MSGLKYRCARSRPWLMLAVATMAVGVFTVAGCSSESPPLPAAPAVAGGAPPPPAFGAPPPPGSFAPSVPAAGGPPAPGSVGPPAPGAGASSATTPGAPASAVAAAPVGPPAPAAKNGPLVIHAPKPLTLAPDLAAAASKVKLPARCSVLVPCLPSGFIAVGEFTTSPVQGVQVWDLTSMTIAYEFRGPPTKNGSQFTLSPDGAHLAAVVTDQGDAQVHVYSCSARAKVNSFKPDSSNSSPDFLGFVGPSQLLVGVNASLSPHFKVWDVAAGKFVSEFAVPERIERNAIAISPDGKYVAQFKRRTVQVYEISTGGRVAEANLPAGAPSILNCDCLGFSPDGKELAGLFQVGMDSRLYAWSTSTREPTVDLAFGGSLRLAAIMAVSVANPALQWIGDDGWLLFGAEIVDRTSGRMVWMVGPNEGSRPVASSLVLDRNRLLLAPIKLDESGRLETVPIPWDQIHEALAAIGSDAPAHIRPGQAVSIEVHVADVRFSTPEQTREGLIDTLAKRLAADGIQVADGQATLLEVQYREEAGDTLTERTFQPGAGPFGRPGAPGRSVQATRAICEMAFKVRGDSKPFWQNTVKYDPQSMTFHGSDQFTDSGARESMFGTLKFALLQKPTPYFVARDSKLASLPGMTRVDAGN